MHGLLSASPGLGLFVLSATFTQSKWGWQASSVHDSESLQAPAFGVFVATPPTQLFFPADVHQMQQVVKAVFWSRGLRFIYSTRSKVPEILRDDGTPFFGGEYAFRAGKDDVLVGAAEEWAPPRVSTTLSPLPGFL